jgi:hypothetical protein
MDIMKRMVVLAALLALSGAAFAESGGEPNNTGCNGVGNVNSPCVPSGNGGGGDDPTNPGSQWQGQAQAQQQFQGQVQGQAQFANAQSDATAVAGAVATGGNAFATGGNAFATGGVATGNSLTVAEGAVTNTANGNTLNVAEGAVTNNNTATGGEGGSATATVGDVNVSIADGALRAGSLSTSYSYTEARRAPSIGQGSFAISGCSVGGNAGGSNIHGSAFLGFGWTPQECYKFMLAQAYQSIGEKKAVCDILKNTKVGRRLEKDGIELPECVEQVVIVATPVAAPTPVEPKPVFVEVPPAKISE